MSTSTGERYFAKIHQFIFADRDSARNRRKTSFASVTVHPDRVFRRVNFAAKNNGYFKAFLDLLQNQGRFKASNTAD